MASAAAVSARVEMRGTGVASDHAVALLVARGLAVTRMPGRPDPHPACDWARSGAMALSGEPDGPPRLAPGPLAACARGALQALRALAPQLPADVGEGPSLLGERAALLGLRRGGRVSPGASCRLLRARDAWIALNLARADDVALLPAWLETPSGADPWGVAARGVARGAAAELVARARLLGLAAAPALAPEPVAPPWVRVAAVGPRRSRGKTDPPLVVDLTALWAGPLCAGLLERTGARVVKVESTRRPDGARRGSTAFFDRMNAGKASVALDFETAPGRAALRALVDRADVVVESARPRALAQLGIAAEAWVQERAGRTWLSLTGYGRAEPGAHWVAFGDDAAVAAGLAVATGTPEAPLFCGDAIADPLTGLHAAVAALASQRTGGGELLDLSLRDVVAHTLSVASGAGAARVRRCAGGWEVVADGTRAPVLPPRARPFRARARTLGADTRGVLRGEAIAC